MQDDRQAVPLLLLSPRQFQGQRAEGLEGLLEFYLHALAFGYLGGQASRRPLHHLALQDLPGSPHRPGQPCRHNEDQQLDRRVRYSMARLE